MKKKLRKSAAFFLCMALLTFFVPQTAVSAAAPGETFTVGEFIYQVNADGATVTLIDLGDDMLGVNSLVIPASVTGPDGKTYAVTKTGAGFFEGGPLLESVHIPQGITEIGDRNFRFCPALNTITFDPGMTSLTTIGDEAFQDASLSYNLLRLPYGVTSIGAGAFRRGKPGEVILPDTLTYMGSPEDSMLDRFPTIWLEVGKNTEIIGPGKNFRVSTDAAPDAALEIFGVELRYGGKVTNHGSFPLPARLPDGTMIDVAPGESYALPLKEDADIKLTYIPELDGGTVYRVDITWGALEFSYNEGGPGVWNTQTHTYDGAAEQGWSVDAAGGDLITVANHSNTGIEAEFTYSSETGYETIAATLTGDGITEGRATLPTAENTPPESPPAVTAKVALSGTMPANMPVEQTMIGTVTVTIGGGNE